MSQPLLEQLQAAVGDAFHLERELEGGGMSRLFVANEASLNRHVVIKVLPPEWASDVSAARFKREMEFVAQLQHPHILPVLAAGARAQLLYFVMPYVEGESLRGRLRREGALLIDDARRILSEVADALAFAHERGVIHRDIKPENILLEGKHAVLADFGVARAIIEARTGEKITQTGVSVGTPGYMSPEQVAGDNVDARTDVYALAVVGYEMLTGQPPFTGSSARAVLAAHLTEVPKPIRELRPEVPAELAGAVERALSKDAANRFSSAGEFADAIGVRVGVNGSPRRRGYSWRSLGPRPIAAVSIVVVVLLMSAWAWTRGKRVDAVLARVLPAADSGHLDRVYRILDSAGIELGERRLQALASRIGARLSIETEPSRADVRVVRLQPLEPLTQRPAKLLEHTPVAARTLVSGEYLVTLTAANHAPLDFIVALRPAETLHVQRTLPPPGVEDMVWVSVGPARSGGRVTEAFLIDRHEITNGQYQRFVDAGGYRDPRVWPDTLVVQGRALPRADAVARFVDRTGLPGPRYWSGGRFPSGQEQHPVAGVSWYEASAYAQWAGRSLPSVAQWWRAALEDARNPFPWGRDAFTAEQRANFALAGTRPVGSYPAGVSPFGCHDMAGNVREWLADTPASPNRRIVVGGSWQDPTYMFEAEHAEQFDLAFANQAIGFRTVRFAR